ncbi:MAG: glycosyltransferase [Flavobacterium sp.]|uniref:glycosyltransferase n=1 Tax=Flavobacterium sp. TaxID=239 RepID=UPI00261D4D49|nr:glycosyltransferase [Flavobacterium sp.]MDD5151451.1 glycosyltransferase [Flavobacterium sp.]
MKIIVYFNSMSPAGGIERVISKHIAFFEKYNHEVILLTKDRNKSFYELSQTVKVDSLDVKMNMDMNSRLKRVFQIIVVFFKSVLILRKKIKEHCPDVIYTATPFNLFEVYCSQHHCKNSLITEHSSFLAYNKIYQLIAKKLYKKVKVLTVPTTLDSTYYKSIGINNVYLPNPLPFYNEATAALNNKVVLNVGRFTNDKRHKLLINLWSQAKAKDWGWKLKIIGKGENEMKIKEQIKRLNLEQSIILSLPTTAIEQEYLNASVFVLTSIAEGFGLVLAEAMACGVPCLSFNCPSGPRDIIDNDKNGFLIEEGQHQEFINKLDLLVQDEVLRKEMGQLAKFDIKKFESQIISKKLNELVALHF